MALDFGGGDRCGGKLEKGGKEDEMHKEMGWGGVGKVSCRKPARATPSLQKGNLQGNRAGGLEGTGGTHHS